MHHSNIDTICQITNFVCLYEYLKKKPAPMCLMKYSNMHEITIFVNVSLMELAALVMKCDDLWNFMYWFIGIAQPVNVFFLLPSEKSFIVSTISIIKSDCPNCFFFEQNKSTLKMNILNQFNEIITITWQVGQSLILYKRQLTLPFKPSRFVGKISADLRRKVFQNE